MKATANSVAKRVRGNNSAVKTAAQGIKAAGKGVASTAMSAADVYKRQIYRRSRNRRIWPL